MKIIKNSKELAKLTDKNKDLHLEDEDVRIEFEPTGEEINNIYCRDLFLMNDSQRFNFNGWDFNGGNFNGRDFNGRNFNGWDFNGWDFNGGNFNGRNFNGRNFNGRNFNGWDFNGWDFNGKKVSYYAFFNSYGNIKCENIEGRRDPHQEPVCLDGKLEIIKPDEKPAGKKVKIRIDGGQIIEGEIVE
jgi:hypothetical protein